MLLCPVHPVTNCHGINDDFQFTECAFSVLDYSSSSSQSKLKLIFLSETMLLQRPAECLVEKERIGRLLLWDFYKCSYQILFYSSYLHLCYKNVHIRLLFCLYLNWWCSDHKPVLTKSVRGCSCN